MLKRLMQFFSMSKSNVASARMPTEMKDIGDYRSLFEQSAAFTKKLGFEAPNVSWIDRDVLGQDGDVFRKVGAAANLMDLSHSAGQCLKWCHYIRPYVEQVLEVPVWLTMGQLWAYNKTVFDPSWNDFRQWSVSGICFAELAAQGRGGINLHAWLTVASGELLRLR